MLTPSQQNRKFKRLIKKLGVLALAGLLIFSSFLGLSPSQPVIAAENQNPPLEVIAQKIEQVALEKNIPSQILKAIAFKESSWRQWDKNGKVVMSSGKNPAIGIMQVVNYGQFDTERLKNDIDYNIAAGADVLNQKFASAPKIGNGDRNVLENWYFALWAYNSWAERNNPWVAEASGTKAYQDKVLDLMKTEYLKGGVVTPVEVTPIPKELLPKSGVPDRNSTWATPEPVHYGDLLKNDQTPVQRLGNDGIDTAIQIALAGWPEGTEAVVIARSDDFPDVLAGVPFAYSLNAPILLTPSNELDERVAQALTTLRPTVVYLLGGESALSPQVELSIEALGWTEGEVRRLAGENRYETAAIIAEQFPNASRFALATGLNFPDALGFAPVAAEQQIPILLVAADRVPEATKNYISGKGVEELLVIGGPAAVSEQVVNSLLDLTGIPADKVNRIAGDDRYLTSLAIVQQYSPDVKQIDLATGEDFPYALAGAVFTAKSGSTLLLVSPRGFDPQAANYLSNLSRGISLRIYGGEAVVPPGIVLKAQAYLQDGLQDEPETGSGDGTIDNPEDGSENGSQGDPLDGLAEGY